MAGTETVAAEKLNVFLSYSHIDEAYKNRLDNHLSALKHSNEIATWSDRKIVPSDDWDKEIDQNLTRAHIILLLISSDFLASQFCYNIETLNALDRHRRGQAIVIPVVIREVDFKGLPIEKLQMLPKDAHAVTSKFWHNEDEAFKNVAQGVRRAVDKLRQSHAEIGEIKAQPRFEFERRHFDAAIAGEIPVDEIREVVAKVRTDESRGLLAILTAPNGGKSDYSCRASDIRSEEFEARYEVVDRHRTCPPYRITIDAPGLIIQDADKKFELEWGRDSITFKFLVSSAKVGEQRLRVNVYVGEYSAAEVMLKTNVGGPPQPGGISTMDRLVASVQLLVNVINKAATVGGRSG